MGERAIGTYCGIDVGERKLFAAVIEVDDRKVAEVRFAEITSVDEVIGWVADQQLEAVGIDAPPGPNLGFLNDPEVRKNLGVAKPPENTDRRVAEYQLGIGGCYSTRSEESALSGWMRTGFHVYSELERRTGLSIDRGAGGSIFEIHPTYGFRSLLGVEHAGIRLKCDPDRLLRPKTPIGCPGHQQRVAILVSLLEHFGKTTDDHLKTCLAKSIDRTDALLGALLGLLRDLKLTMSVGSNPEGAIHLAAPAKLGTLANICKRTTVDFDTMKSSANNAASDVSSTKRPVRRAVVRDVTGFLLRLGENAFGRLSQKLTIDTVLSMISSEGQAVVPLNIKKIAAATIEMSQTERLTVLVGYGGRLILEFRGARIIGKGATAPMFGEEFFGNGLNPWGGIDAVPYWLISETVQMVDAEDHYESLETWRSEAKEWQRGVPANQSAWLRYRRPVTD